MRQRNFRVTHRIGFRLLFPALLLFSLAAGAGEKKSVSLRDQLARLGYEQIELLRSGENRLFLFGKLDGRKQSVLVDTGWSFTTVSTNAAVKLTTRHELKLPPGDPFPGTNAEGSTVVINNLSLGRVAFTNQPALVQDLVFNGQRAPFDVVLGCDFLLRNFAVVDYLNRRLYTRRSSPSKQQQTELEHCLTQSGYVPVELKRTSPLALTCPSLLNGELVELLVDTGAVWSCLDTDLAKSLGLKLLPTPRQITGAGATGKRGFVVAKVDSVELGRAPVRSLTFAVLNLGDWGLAAPGAALASVRGIIGGPELAAYRAIIDCHGFKLWLKPATARR